ncbi:MAG: type VI secretion system ATPase TssH, partial [Armatimonadetes bacterium]|nr:type VI secretion system ATPase TssH [Armatimonadota bacterium]
MDRLTVKAQEALQAAQGEAAQNGQQEIASEHLLAALLDQTEGIITPLLQKMGANVGAVRQDLDREIARLPKVGGVVVGEYLSNRLRRTLEIAWQEAQQLKDEYCSTEHLLLALAAETDTGAGRVLRSHGVTRERLLQALVDVRGSARVTDPHAEETYQALEKFGRDLTDAARRGKLDPVIGRDEE